MQNLIKSLYVSREKSIISTVQCRIAVAYDQGMMIEIKERKKNKKRIMQRGERHTKKRGRQMV